MEHNPYSPPRAEIQDPPPFPEGDLLAGRGRRFATAVLDQIGILFLAMFIGVAVALVNPALIEDMGETNDLLLGVVLTLVYYLPQEAMFGRTLGKLIAGTRVVDDQGGEPRLRQIVGRTFARLIPFEAFTFLRAESVGLHDRLSDTRVVRTRL